MFYSYKKFKKLLRNYLKFMVINDLIFILIV